MDVADGHIADPLETPHRTSRQISATAQKRRGPPMNSACALPTEVHLATAPGRDHS